MVESHYYDVQRSNPEHLPDEPVSAFLQWYNDRTRADLYLQNHVTYITYTSDPVDVNDRRNALEKYLKHFPHPGQHSWGRSLFAEVVIEEILRKQMQKMLREQNLKLVASPTSIDHSIFDPVGSMYYQKGADMCLIDAETDIPQGGIDVTTGGSLCIKQKRKQIGLQSLIAMPVIIFPLSHIPLSHDCFFQNYLDGQAREMVLQTGRTEEISQQPLLNMTRDSIKNTLLEGIEYCRPGLQSPQLKDYPWLTDVTGKLHTMKKLVQEYM